MWSNRWTLPPDSTKGKVAHPRPARKYLGRKKRRLARAGNEQPLHAHDRKKKARAW
jgi:hypothetical protein